MTKKEFYFTFDILTNVQDEDDITINKWLDKEVKRLLESGVVDIKDYENNFILPKIILRQALINLAEQYNQFPKDTATKKLQHF